MYPHFKKALLNKSFSQDVEKNFDNNTSLNHSLSLNFIFERYCFERMEINVKENMVENTSRLDSDSGFQTLIITPLSDCFFN